MPLVLVRHAWAGDRDEWNGDDRERPLDERGRQQSRDLIARLESLPVEEILSSPYRRCVQTVEPLASVRGLELILRPELGEDRQEGKGRALVRQLAERDIVVCGHGGLQDALIDPPKWRKGIAFVVGPDLTVEDVL